ncbi:mitogen-activated protein kinase kinase kinase A-like [Canna indica]|uniref:Mitogen-activated protein kinase kinase kinase A-like n=1 Tax=Canna indica TaxID=4628 RepID=A0AAQ3K6H0_9LILI|nr:mitogen-activated protein kinase kinase kinase A-like [Canna indica]
MGVGGWRRGRIIGRGASAAVSLATSVASGQVFAVKSSELSRSGPLQFEQRILSSLDSPFVVSYFGFDVAQEAPGAGIYYNLFIEYAPGGSLADEIKKQGGRLDELAVRSYTYDILRGLAYLHSDGVVHCDLKSENVLVCSGGRAKIADFGCARRADGGEGEIVRLQGTPMFMAPEVARGEEQNAPADVWALGCTIIEMATGRPPWPHVSDAVGALHRIAFSTDVPELPSWISKEGKDFLSRCLRRDPKERWTAEQLLQHPFLASFSANSEPKSDSSDERWVSPKSTLDQAPWESLSDEEDEVEEQPPADVSERIQSIIGGGRGTPNWTWDDSWVVVRSNSGECSFPATDSTARDKRSGCREAFEDDSGSKSSSEENFMSHMDIEHVIDSSCNHPCLECNHSNVIDASVVQVDCKLVVNFINEKINLILSTTRNSLLGIFHVCIPLNCYITA